MLRSLSVSAVGVGINDDSTIFMGLDVHKKSNLAAYSISLGEVQSLGNIGVLEPALVRLCTRMQSKGSRVVFVYEVGPCGYALPLVLI